MNVLHGRNHLPPVTILHTADLHLPEKMGDSRGGKDADQQVPFRSLRAIVDTANNLEVDLVLFSGDLFDTYQPSQEVVFFALEQLSNLRPPAILIPGNHDCLGEANTFNKPEWTGRDMNPYVVTQPHGESLEVPGLPMVVWGRAMVDHSPDFQPLEGLPLRQDDAWHVAMGHGFYYEDANSNGRSSPIHADQIRTSGWDYIALGHKHLYTDVSQGGVKAAYSGAPVPSWSHEEAKALLVRLDASRTESVSVRELTLFGENDEKKYR